MKYIDPITFKIIMFNDSELERLRINFLGQIKNEIHNDNNFRALNFNEKLRTINNIVATNFYFIESKNEKTWGQLPADSRIPGNFSMMADHLIATSCIGIALAVEAFEQGVNFAEDYQDVLIKDLVSKKSSLIQIVRFCCLLHDIGKYPVKKHDVRSAEIIKGFLKELNFTNELLIEFIASSAAKHHYGSSYSDERRPKTKIQWIVALADKVATQDRAPLSDLDILKDQLMDPLNWIMQNEEEANKQTILNIISFIKQPDQYQEHNAINLIFPINQSLNIKFNQKLLQTSDIFNTQESLKLSLLICEGKAIQAFIRRSEKRKYLTGASSLIASAFNEISNIIKKELALESIIYTSSGSLLAIIPSSLLDAFKEKISTSYVKIVREGAGLNLSQKVSSAFSLYELKSGPSYAWNYKVGINRRNFGELYNVAISNSKTSLSYGKTIREEINNICRNCFINPRTLDKNLLSKLQNEGKEIKICETCAYVLLHEKSISEDQFGLLLKIKNNSVDITYHKTSETRHYANLSPIIEILKFLKDYLKLLIEQDKALLDKLQGKTIVFKYDSDFNNLGKVSKLLIRKSEKESSIEAEVHDVVYIKGDGDNFGQIKSLMPNITMYRKISQIFYQIITGALFKSLARILHFQLKKAESDEKKLFYIPFYVIYFSGDDFFIVMDAGFTHIFLKYFQYEVQYYLGKNREDYNKDLEDPLAIFKLGISMGCLICKNRTPIYLILEALNELEELAKKKSKTKRKKFGGEICVALQKFDSVPNNILIERRYNDKNLIKRTKYPMLSGELEEFQNELRTFIQNNIGANNLNNLIIFKEQLDDYNRIQRLRLELKYRQARDFLKKNGKEEMERYKLILEKVFNKGDNNQVLLKDLDFIESLKIIYESEELL